MNRRARRRVRAALFLCCALLFPFPLAPQEPPPAGEQGAAGEQNPGEQPAQADQDAEPGPPSEHTVLEMDIKTSTLSELAAWCRLLGLSEAGAREDLAGRLRGYYALPPPVAPEEKQRVITIEAARTTEYFTLEVVDESYARLQGGVVISLKDGEAVHRIKAGEILYNRTRNIMTASGSVEYVKREGDTTETFRGESITVNLDSWSSIFLDGLTERALGAGAADANTYRFAGTLIARSNEEVTVLENATVTNAKNEEAYWSLNARKLWLLPGSDWAVLGAVLKVGEIPVFYFPFFHFAADEVIFHPALGYRSRVGNFVQTTTYLLGRPKRDGAKESSLSKMMGTAGESERVREGIFLRSTGKKAKDPNEARLSVLFDAYANLGTYLGTELVLPKKGILGAIGLSAGIGFTRDIYRVNAAYSPFAQYDGSDNWNSANLFSVEVPFRYRFITTGSLSGKYGSLNWSFPFYTDLYVNQDFMERSEEMDWVALFKRDAEEEAANKNVLGSSYEWRINASLAPITKLAPYVSSFSVSNISSGVVFRSRQSTVINNGVSPNRSCLFPDTQTHN
ncbi:MAG: hypothetical protein LBD13_01595 [Spirochaetaceae bacterium]|jgi:lipopolysaccharide assembly outer membrane protein LptD (OstA)|nr:hypothetical protein [Spirochaetaceae bacterium]